MQGNSPLTIVHTTVSKMKEEGKGRESVREKQIVCPKDRWGGRETGDKSVAGEGWGTLYD